MSRTHRGTFMVSKPALQLVIGASVDWTVGAAFKTIEERIRKLQSIGSSTEVLDKLIGQALRFGDELTRAHGRGAIAAREMRSYLQANLEVLRLQTLEIAKMGERYRSLARSASAPQATPQGRMPVVPINTDTEWRDMAVWGTALTGVIPATTRSPAKPRGPRGATRNPPEPPEPPARDRPPRKRNLVNKESLKVAAFGAVVKTGAALATDQTEKERLQAYSQIAGGLVGGVALGAAAALVFLPAVPYAEALGAIGGEALARLLFDYFYDDENETKSPGAVASGALVTAIKPGALVRPLTSPVPAADAITHLARMPLAAPQGGALLRSGQDEAVITSSLSSWMDKRWFGASYERQAPDASKPEGIQFAPVAGPVIGATESDGGCERCCESLSAWMGKNWFAAQRESATAATANEQRKLSLSSMGDVPRKMMAEVTAPMALSSQVPFTTPQVPAGTAQPITQQITFAPNMPITVQGSVADSAELARNIEPIVRRQFDEIARMAANRQLADPTFV